MAIAPAVLLASDNRWATAVGGLAILVTALRTRAFPLTVQQMALWFAVLAALGIAGIIREPDVIRALNLVYGVELLAAGGWPTLAILGAVVVAGARPMSSATSTMSCARTFASSRTSSVVRPRTSRSASSRQ